MIKEHLSSRINQASDEDRKNTKCMHIRMAYVSMNHESRLSGKTSTRRYVRLCVPIRAAHRVSISVVGAQVHVGLHPPILLVYRLKLLSFRCVREG